MNVQHFLRLCWLCETMVIRWASMRGKGRRRVSESKEKKVEAQQKIVIQQKYIDRCILLYKELNPVWQEKFYIYFWRVWRPRIIVNRCWCISIAFDIIRITEEEEFIVVRRSLSFICHLFVAIRQTTSLQRYSSMPTLFLLLMQIVGVFVVFIAMKLAQVTSDCDIFCPKQLCSLYFMARNTATLHWMIRNDKFICCILMLEEILLVLQIHVLRILSATW